MKVIEFSRYGVPHEVCACVDRADVGTPAAGEVVVSVDASPINPADLLIIQGRYPGPATLPARLGIEGTGRIEAVAEDVTDLTVGDQVILLDRCNWAERVRTPAERVISIPPQLDVLQAAMMKVNPPTALLMLRNYVDLKPGDWIIQDAANSAVGHHVVRLARSRGVRSVNVVRRPEVAEVLKTAGADLVMVDGDDLGERVRAEIGDARLPLALDAVGGVACLHLADCLSDGGKLITYGFLSGEPCMISPHHAIVHGITLEGFWLVQRLFQGTRDDIKAVYREIAELITTGTLVAPVEAVYGLEDVDKALANAEAGGRSGKILFAPNGPVS